MEYLQLVWSFFKIGILTFGGGYAMLPMIQREIVERRGWATEEEILAAIGELYREDHYLMDTHTAVAYKVYRDYKAQTGDETPTVIASTASPYKFAAAVSGAIGLPKAEDEFAAIDALNAASGVRVPYGLKDLKSREILHKGAIAREDMKDFVRETIKSRI